MHFPVGAWEKSFHQQARPSVFVSVLAEHVTPSLFKNNGFNLSRSQNYCVPTSQRDDCVAHRDLSLNLQHPLESQV